MLSLFLSYCSPILTHFIAPSSLNPVFVLYYFNYCSHIRFPSLSLFVLSCFCFLFFFIFFSLLYFFSIMSSFPLIMQTVCITIIMTPPVCLPCNLPLFISAMLYFTTLKPFLTTIHALYQNTLESSAIFQHLSIAIPCMLSRSHLSAILSTAHAICTLL